MDNSLGKIYIRKRTVPEWLVAFVFFLPFFQELISEFFGVPDVIKFLVDIILVLLLLKICMISTEIQVGKAFHPFLVLIGIFFAYVTITYFFNYQSIFYFLWGLRNYFRFYVAFITYVIFLKWEDVQKWLKYLDCFYVINFFVVVVQFIMGYKQDYLGGIFGVQKGCNGVLLVFMILIATKTVLSFMRNECSVAKCLIFSFLGLSVAALAELKFFFVLFIVAVIVAALITKSSVKKTVFFIFCSIAIAIFSTALSLMYDEFEDFLSWEKLWLAITNPNYATEEDIGRFSAIPIISERFLTGFPDKLFGMGLGNADTSTLAIFNTPFFEAYGFLHYAIFSYSFLYLETGIVGLLLYALFFIITFVVTLRLYIAKMADEMICQLAMIFSGFCVILMFYNTTLRTELSAYLIYFVLALPLISSGAAKPRQDIRR